MLREAFHEGTRAAFRKFAQPSLASVGIQTKGLPAPGKPPSLNLPNPAPAVPASPPTSLGLQAAKVAFNVGMGGSSAPHDGPGAVPGEPADEGRRQRSVVDRAFQQNEDTFATSSMPEPGGKTSP